MNRRNWMLVRLDIGWCKLARAVAAEAEAVLLRGRHIDAHIR